MITMNIIMNGMICSHNFKKTRNKWMGNIFSNEIIIDASNPKKNPFYLLILNKSNHMI
jgi:ribosomal protein L28